MSRVGYVHAQLSWSLLRQLDKLVRNGYFTSRSEALRYAIKKLLAENNHCGHSEEEDDVLRVVKRYVLTFLEMRKRRLIKVIANETGISMQRIAPALDLLIKNLREKWRVEE